jgi:hypothetical protein
MGGGISWGSGQLKSIEWPRWGSGRCPGGQAEMGEQLCFESSGFHGVLRPEGVGFQHRI